MPEAPPPSSGSRWEPESTPEGEEPAADPTAEHPQVPVDDVLTEERERPRRRIAIQLAAGAAALTVASGVTGFVIGHTTAGSGNDGLRPTNFSGQQGPPAFGDRDGDGQGPPGQNLGDGSGGTNSSSNGAGAGAAVSGDET